MLQTFYKYQGTGNDFIIFDNRDGSLAFTNEQIRKLCDRRFGIGADGLMLLGIGAGFDFTMQYYNSDGKESSMCGNGGRCLVKFAYQSGIHRSKYHFKASDGEHEATIEENGWVHLKMRDVSGVKDISGDRVLNTGSPHYVKPTAELANFDVVSEGRAIRNSPEFSTEGINVNFVEVKNKSLFVRTYERGVEEETLSCGTGVTASALVFAHNESGFNRVEVETRGGKLAVEFDKTGSDEYQNIWLCGPAEFVFKGEIEV